MDIRNEMLRERLLEVGQAAPRPITERRAERVRASCSVRGAGRRNRAMWTMPQRMLGGLTRRVVSTGLPRVGMRRHLRMIVGDERRNVCRVGCAGLARMAVMTV